MPTSTSPERRSTGSPTAGSLGAVVPASTFELGSVGPASGEEAHPAISIAIATVIAIRGRLEFGEERIRRKRLSRPRALVYVEVLLSRWAEARCGCFDRRRSGFRA